MNLYPGNHLLSATQTSTLVGGSTFTSDASGAAGVTVYAPPSAPSLKLLGERRNRAHHRNRLGQLGRGQTLVDL